MNKEIITFGDIEIEKRKLHYYFKILNQHKQCRHLQNSNI